MSDTPNLLTEDEIKFLEGEVERAISTTRVIHSGFHRCVYSDSMAEVLRDLRYYRELCRRLDDCYNLFPPSRHEEALKALVDDVRAALKDKQP